MQWSGASCLASIKIIYPPFPSKYITIHYSALDSALVCKLSTTLHCSILLYTTIHCTQNRISPTSFGRFARRKMLRDAQNSGQIPFPSELTSFYSSFRSSRLPALSILIISIIMVTISSLGSWDPLGQRNRDGWFSKTHQFCLVT